MYSSSCTPYHIAISLSVLWCFHSAFSNFTRFECSPGCHSLLQTYGMLHKNYKIFNFLYDKIMYLNNHGCWSKMNTSEIYRLRLNKSVQRSVWWKPRQLYVGMLACSKLKSNKLYKIFFKISFLCTRNYRKVSNIRRTLVGKKIVDHSDVVGASPVGAAPTTSSFST